MSFRKPNRIFAIICVLLFSTSSCNEMPECRTGRVKKIGKPTYCLAEYKVCEDGKWNGAFQSLDYEIGAECEPNDTVVLDCPHGAKVCFDDCKWSKGCIIRSCENWLHEIRLREPKE
jgi:hypothetical protein